MGVWQWFSWWIPMEKEICFKSEGALHFSCVTRNLWRFESYRSIIVDEHLESIYTKVSTTFDLGFGHLLASRASSWVPLYCLYGWCIHWSAIYINYILYISAHRFQVDTSHDLYINIYSLIKPDVPISNDSEVLCRFCSRSCLKQAQGVYLGVHDWMNQSLWSCVP